MSIFIKKKCAVDGCNSMGRNKGRFANGRQYYGNVCDYHHRLKSGKNKSFSLFIKQRALENKKCKICGWDKGPCDRHRIDPQLGYTKDNVIILCPNCHRLETMGLLKH